METGRHQELVDRGGAYADMWLRQVEASKADAPVVLEDGSAPSDTGAVKAAAPAPRARQRGTGTDDGHHHGHHGHGFH